MAVDSAVEAEIRELILRNGRITFAQFMRACLYSPGGGFYSTRGGRSDLIGAHFGTSSTSHPVFGALIARQLEQMWHILDKPAVFHVVEVGSGGGSLAQVHCQRLLAGVSPILPGAALRCGRLRARRGTGPFQRWRPHIWLG